ncbi:hypothetical protein RUM43_002374 [Polyplax serrata]|uniref:Uncharacterized protein n=1 Tax=Polyplax serrata TaxID=468196 RepID=A0AAN8NT98_POLSC
MGLVSPREEEEGVRKQSFHACREKVIQSERLGGKNGTAVISRKAPEEKVEKWESLTPGKKKKKKITGNGETSPGSGPRTIAGKVGKFNESFLDSFHLLGKISTV